MRSDKPKDVAASIRALLLNISRERGETHDLTLAHYATERMLYRLSVSPYRDRFVLKGAQLFAVWTGQVYRPTRDVDFLGFGDVGTEQLGETFRDICSIEVDPEDGLSFDPRSVKAEEIREDQQYGGIRVTLTAYLGRARIPLQVDVGFGDAITPGVIDTDFPTLLDQPKPRLLTYPVETVIAEKLGRW